ncbi:PTS transporter subunit EIIB, partial [Clostridioides difficile]
YRTAKPENRKALKGLLISGVLTVIIGGISEPIEFLFLFISPALFAFHTFMNGLANMVLPYLGVLMGFTGDLIAFISFGVLRGTATGWPIAVLVAVLYFAIYYFVFKWAIIKFNIKTPGREDKEIKVSEGNGSDFKNLSTYKGQQMISALGGQSNILSLDNCVTRLRLKLQDVSLI